jgi:hypothetical protein
MLMGFAVVRGGIFGSMAGLSGVLGSGLLLGFTTWVTFVRARFRSALAVAGLGGILSLAWYAQVARGLWRLGR